MSLTSQRFVVPVKPRLWPNLLLISLSLTGGSVVFTEWNVWLAKRPISQLAVRLFPNKQFRICTVNIGLNDIMTDISTNSLRQNQRFANIYRAFK
ncbi:hypothetical protein AVEN_171778-1 [Araneus ventricosus]|uniref:Uncharacterized protein n=1 Tax=Araneus ventricosus TaxID=182803 RepID=A0A4Y2R5T7_ARAVE|nr:hypothetical protein AVEN_171778-1 [Araneus ventricosus]